MNYTTKQLAENYNEAFPKYPPLAYTDRWVYGIWSIGANFRSKSKFYGQYPPTLLKRYSAMFTGIDKVLHLFSGAIEQSEEYTTFDLVQKADVQGDAQKLSQYFPDQKFNLIYADPPYTKQDAEKYCTTLPNRKKVIHECYKVLNPGGFLVWLDTMKPMWRKTEFEMIGTIGMDRSSNHRVRMIFIFRRTT